MVYTSTKSKSTVKPRRHFFKVGVPKFYYDPENRPKDKLTAYVEVHRVLAISRVEAAKMVWERHGERLLREMTPGRKMVSFYVNDPVRRICAGRLATVRVYCEHINVNETTKICRFCREKTA